MVLIEHYQDLVAYKFYCIANIYWYDNKWDMYVDREDGVTGASALKLVQKYYAPSEQEQKL